MADIGILEWAEKQAEWVRDALRRHAARPGFHLEGEDHTGIEAGVRQLAGFPSETAPAYVPLSADHLESTKASGERALLCSLGPVKHLNRLAGEQRLRFALDGITVIYGDNGSGKSGYTRIAKKLCRSLTSDDLLGNVFEKEIAPPAEILVRFVDAEGTEPVDVVWTDGTTPPEQIASISVFDSANARLYVDKRNRIGFLPSDIALLEQHGNHRGAMEGAFKKEIEAIDKKMKTALPSGYAFGGDIAKVLASLDIKSKAALPSRKDIEDLALCTEAEALELKALEFALASDPATMAAKRRRAKTVISKFILAAETIDQVLSKSSVADYREHRANAQLTAEAAKLAASDAFKSEKLPGVGLDTWKLMFLHAKAYAATFGEEHETLPSEETDLCVLCQRPLEADGAMRMKSFNDFISSAANTAAEAADAKHSASLKNIFELEIGAVETIAHAMAEFGDLSAARKELVPNILKYFQAAEERRKAVVGSVGIDQLPELVDFEAVSLQSECDALEAEAQLDDQAAADDKARLADRKRRDDLKDRKKLSDDLGVVLARRDDLDERKKLVACCEAVENRSVSLQMTALRRSLVMENLEKRIRCM